MAVAPAWSAHDLAMDPKPWAVRVQSTCLASMHMVGFLLHPALARQPASSHCNEFQGHVQRCAGGCQIQLHGTRASRSRMQSSGRRSGARSARRGGKIPKRDDSRFQGLLQGSIVKLASAKLRPFQEPLAVS